MLNKRYDIYDEQIGLDGLMKKPSRVLVYSQEEINTLPNPISESLSIADLTDGSQNPLLSYNKKNFLDTSAGKIEGVDNSDGTYKWLIGNSSNSVDWNVTSQNTLTINGDLVAVEIHVPDKNTTANSFHVNENGDTWWGTTDDNFNTDNDNAAAYILKTGVGKLNNTTIKGSLNVSTSGNVRSGQTAYNTGTGWLMEYNAGTPRFSIGDGTVNNSLTWDGTTLLVNGSAIAGNDTFGDGSDGSVTISGDTTLTSDMFYNNLTVNNGFTLNPGGYRIFVKGTLTNNGTIARNGGNGGNGGNASGTTAGTAGSGTSALADGSIKGALAGVAGQDGRNGVIATGYNNGNNGNNGGNGTNVAKSLVSADGIAGKNGGEGGDLTDPPGANGGSLGTGGTAGTRTGTVYNKINCATAAYLMYDTNGSDTLKSAPSNGGAGSGGSGAAGRSNSNESAQSGGTGGSGGGGGNGAIVLIFAKTIINAGTISANGGNGGNAGTTVNSSASNPQPGSAAAGGSGGSGGGNGGNSGIVIVVYSSLSGAGTIIANGGTGGTRSIAGLKAEAGESATAGTDGVAGSNGNAGTIIQLLV